MCLSCQFGHRCASSDDAGGGGCGGCSGDRRGILGDLGLSSWIDVDIGTCLDKFKGTGANGMATGPPNCNGIASLGRYEGTELERDE